MLLLLAREWRRLRQLGRNPRLHLLHEGRGGEATIAREPRRRAVFYNTVRDDGDAAKHMFPRFPARAIDLRFDRYDRRSKTVCAGSVISYLALQNRDAWRDAWRIFGAVLALSFVTILRVF